MQTGAGGPTTTPKAKAKALKDPKAPHLEAGPGQRLETRAYTEGLSSSALRSWPSGYQPGEHPCPTQQTTVYFLERAAKLGIVVRGLTAKRRTE